MRTSDVLAVQVKAQNATLVVRKRQEDTVFECFEASALSEAVISCEGSLLRTFPTHAVAIPTSTFESSRFRLELAATLEKLDAEVIHEVMPDATKANTKVTEIWETADPRLVTEMLMAALAAVGRPAKVRRVEKRIRDDVVWDERLLPWRRSPLWLSIRVTLQTTLAYMLADSEARARILYKNFMAFLMVELASLASAANLPGDLLLVIHAKVARRIFKLGVDAAGFVTDRALSVSRITRESQDKIWSAIQARDAERDATIAVDRPLRLETSLTLRSSREYLDSVLSEDPGNDRNPPVFLPTCKAWISHTNRGLPEVDRFDITEDELGYMLAAFESWVSGSLPAWVLEAMNAPCDDDCLAVASLAKDYHARASSAYKHAPEQNSIMILTLAELWQTVDLLATRLLPLLKEFSPAISQDFLYPILAPQLQHMQRLAKIEAYIVGREQQAKTCNLSIFSERKEQSFAVQFSESSEKHKALRRKIVKQASKEELKKREEHARKEEEICQMQEEAQKLTCQQRIDETGLELLDTDCTKCELEKLIAGISIFVYEWPIPENEADCVSAVFELDCPSGFAAWRSITWIIINDLGRPPVNCSDKPAATLLGHPGLQGYAKKTRSRLTFASKRKPFTEAHYRELSFPVPVEKCIVPNALEYQLFDSQKLVWVHGQASIIPSIERLCNTELPEGPYLNLQYAVNSTSHEQNHVIAEQEICSTELSLQEYIAFGSLRADGERVQWLNIKRELTASNLSLNTEAVCTLLTQAAWQAGSRATGTSKRYKLPSGGSVDEDHGGLLNGAIPDRKSILRMPHGDFHDLNFCKELMSTVSSNLDRIEANWNSDHALSLLVIITLRTISLSTEAVIVNSAVKILHRIRDVAEKWVHDLAKLMHEAYADEQISKLQRRILRAAILCRMTYNVDLQYHSTVLRTTEDVRCWIICSVRLRENTPGDKTSLPLDLRRLMLRDQRLSLSMHQMVHRLALSEDNAGLNLAIGQILTGYESRSTSWTSLADTQNRWVHMKTQASLDQTTQHIHYNILEGELIVDGVPVGRLPKEYSRSDLYKRIFGSQILDVFPADMQGMSFMTVEDVHDHKVYFAMRDGEIVVRTRKGQRTLELVPQDYFDGDLPVIFIEDYTHWLDLSSKEIEFRPLDLPWRSSESNWRLQYEADFGPYLSKGERRLVDVRSDTCVNVMKVFKSLEAAKFVHIILHKDIELEVFLPRLKLNFFLNRVGDMECRELRRVVDHDQSLGTLIGLKSRLVLCGLGDLAKKHDRIVIIPFGEPHIVSSGAHLEVNIVASSRDVTYFNYRHDKELQRLYGDGKMSSSLYRAYLHALTSYIYPDPFTACTGTDEALTCLQEQLIGCSEPLDEESIKLIVSISALTPAREYYPKRLKAMQQIKWHSTLSAVAQHDDFFYLAEKIVVSANRFVIFYPDRQMASLKSSSDRKLLQRARFRNSNFRSSHSGGNVFPHCADVDYEARDQSSTAERAVKVYEIASLIIAWPQRSDVSEDLFADLLTLGMMSGFRKAYSTSRPLSELLELCFASSWGSLHELCRSSLQEDKYRLLFLFSIIAYSKKASDLVTLRTLLAFAFVPELGRLKPPPYSYFNLDIGCAPTESALRKNLQNHKLTFRVPRGTLAAESRQLKVEHKSKVERQISLLVGYYERQWPRRKPDAPATGMASLLDVKGFSSQMSNLFLECSNNVKFTSWLHQVQTVLTAIRQKSMLLQQLPSDWQSSERISVSYVDTRCKLPAIDVLMCVEPPGSMPLSNILSGDRESVQFTTNENLHSVVTTLRSNSRNLRQNSIRQLYSDELMASLNAYQNHRESPTPTSLPQSVTRTVFHRIMVQHHVTEMSKQVREKLSPNSQVSLLLELAGLWPRLTLRSLLKLLSETSDYVLCSPWQTCLLALGEAVTMLQRARRLVLAGERLDVSTFYAEIENTGRQGWQSSDMPDWLLIEIENDFLIRPIQAQVALAMIQPSSSANSLIQLNMGEGKSSVIIPLVAVALANGRRMVRIIVLKSLSKQMSHTMTRRLGGLVSRKLYYMPFSRDSAVEGKLVRQIDSLQKECMNDKGVLLAQPEHILSFKLMGIERLTSGHYRLASQLLASQKWLEGNSRDILDESDEILDVRFQLIYTLGTQRMLNGQPDRWKLTQEAFDLVDKHVSALQNAHDRLELERRSPSSFPTVRLLSTGIGHTLLSLVARDVVDSQLPGLNLTRFDVDVKEAILRFIREHRVIDADCLTIKDSFACDQTVLQELFLIRGLIAHKILLFVLREKRWSVNYGLHPTRCLSAVPYRAKGVPASNAVFGHPDVAIALTCLTYYYSGLTDSQIRKCFELLQKSDDPMVEYTRWTHLCTTIPDTLRDWSAVNLEDDRQCHNELFPVLRFNKKLADYFLNAIVFPQEGKEFDEKLSTSGWDIPSRPGAENISTGFSGTNDNRFLLPLTISQQDLPELQHTSGKVLDYVTRPENLRYCHARDENGQQMPAEHLLEFITNVEPKIRVLIDVGAQVLDKCNEDVVRYWMQLIPSVDAGVYFDADDNIMILPRDDPIAESLAASSFQSRMDRCVVYLDEVHTRGTDLKLPNDARAAVTLGPRLTKDKLVQGMQTFLFSFRMFSLANEV